MSKSIAVVLLSLLAFGCSSTENGTESARNATVPLTNETPDQQSFKANAEPHDRGVLNIAVKNWGQPPYPDEAKKRGIGGTVRVRVTVDTDGLVSSAKAEEGHPLLVKAAEEWASGLQIQPFLVGGEAAKSSGILVVKFGT